MLTVADTLGKDAIIVNATGCMEITSTLYPQSAWRVPYIHSLFENAPAIASGVVNALRAKGNDHTTVCVIAGDGSTYDIGFGALSGMLERDEDVIYICLHPEEKIILSDGTLKKICDIVEPNLSQAASKGGQISVVESSGFLSCENSQRSSAVSFNGTGFSSARITHVQKKKSPDTLAVITSRAGGKIRLTPEHLVLTDSEEGFVWKRADELKRGDRLICPRKIPGLNSRPRQKLAELSGLEKNKHFRKTPDGKFTTQGATAFGLDGLLDEDIAYLLGLIASEGSLARGYAVTLTNKDAELLSIFEDIVSRRFSGRKINRITQNGVGRLTVAHPGLRLLCEKMQIKTGASELLAFDESIISSFLGGLFDGDGCISAMRDKNGNVNARAGIATVNEALGITIKVMLSRVGIASAKLSGRRHDVITYSYEEAEKFVDKVGFRSACKRETANIVLCECRKSGKNNRANYFDLAPKACIRLIRDAVNRSGASFDSIDDNFGEVTAGRRGITKKKILSLLAKLGRVCSEEEQGAIERLCSPDFFFDEVKGVEAERSDTAFVYDVTIEGTHNFIPASAGFVVSNCYNNELYANTGVQKSGATPFGASTNTSQVGSAHHGKESNRKPLIDIVAAHGISYCAQTNIAFRNDVIARLKKAMEHRGGSRVIDVYSPCQLGAGFDGSQSMQIGKLAVQTRMWPMFEVENGEYRLSMNVKKEQAKPVLECLKLQKRFKHLAPEEVAEAQRRTDAYWNHLMKLCGMPVDG
jgi:pyruvate/2-oxoacid:ferredoxin oxidoreductase beta subunit/intein/homing endonuclease